MSPDTLTCRGEQTDKQRMARNSQQVEKEPREGTSQKPSEEGSDPASNGTDRQTKMETKS